MRSLLLTAALTCAVVPIVMAQGGEERWELTITLGPCEAFDEGTFTVLHGGSIGRYLVGELEAESQCTGELAQDSTFELSSGIATATHSLEEDELVISIEDSDGFFKLVSKGSTPMGRRTGAAYACFFPEDATWDVWQGLDELNPYFEQYDQLSDGEQTAIAAQAGLIGLSLSISCIKGTFSMRTR